MTLFDLIRIKLTQFISSVLVLLGLAYRTKSAVFYVTGRFLRDNDRQNVILRGVNLPLLDDWAFPGSDKIDQVAKSGANAIRLQWYVTYPKPGRPAYGIPDLDGILDKCRLSRMIPIVELHDLTCESDPDLLGTQLMPWWTRADVVTMLKRHQRYLIINLANEFGVYRWQDSSPAALAAFKDAYKQAITAIRGRGLIMPIMIDAPDCGTSLNAFLQIGQELITHDPRHSILLSVHSYWAGDYVGTADVALAVNAGLPIVFGEIANKQEVNGDQCHYALDGTGLDNPPPSGFQYQNLLAQLKPLQVGWLAWAWYKDACAARCITPDGNYGGAGAAGLTPYGDDILNNPTYGLLAVPPKRTASLPGAAPFP